MKVYLAGPMSSIAAFNYPAFHAAEAQLTRLGYEVESPARNFPEPERVAWETALRKALVQMLGCQAVVVLPGWERSRGANLEVTVARALGMEVMDLDAVVTDREAGS